MATADAGAGDRSRTPEGVRATWRRSPEHDDRVGRRAGSGIGSVGSGLRSLGRRQWDPPGPRLADGLVHSIVDPVGFWFAATTATSGEPATILDAGLDPGGVVVRVLPLPPTTRDLGPCRADRRCPQTRGVHHAARGARGWLVDIVIGTTVGAIAGAIVAVNVVIYAGPDQGYESSIGDVFDHSALLGLVVVAMLAGGPIVGIVIARRHRRHRAEPERSGS